MKTISYSQFCSAYEEAERSTPLKEIVALMKAVNFRWAGEIVTVEMVKHRLYSQRAHVWDMIHRKGIGGVHAMCSGGFRVAWKYWEHVECGKVAISFKLEEMSAPVEPYDDK